MELKQLTGAIMIAVDDGAKKAFFQQQLMMLYL
jgi:hypothetical protein